MFWVENPFIDPGVSAITVGELFLRGVPLQPLAHSDGDMPEVAQRSSAVPNFGVLQRPPARLHRIDEILFVAFEREMDLTFADD